MRCVCESHYSSYDNHILCPDCRKALGEEYSRLYQAWYDMLYHTEEDAYSQYRQQYLGRRVKALSSLSGRGRITEATAVRLSSNSSLGLRVSRDDAA